MSNAWDNPLSDDLTQNDTSAQTFHNPLFKTGRTVITRKVHLYFRAISFAFNDLSIFIYFLSISIFLLVFFFLIRYRVFLFILKSFFLKQYLGQHEAAQRSCVSRVSFCLSLFFLASHSFLSSFH